MSLRAAVVAPLAALALLTGGCGTLANQSPPGTLFNAGDRTAYQPYGGVWISGANVVWGSALVVGAVENDRHLNLDNVALLTWCSLFELPLCVVADTILLPLDVTNTIRGRGRKQLPDPPAEPDKDAPGEDGGWKATAAWNRSFGPFVAYSHPSRSR